MLAFCRIEIQLREIVMTVKELIEQLGGFNPQTQVVIRGYEGGVTEVEELHLIAIKLNVHEEHYYGAHEYCSETDNDAVIALLIDERT